MSASPTVAAPPSPSRVNPTRLFAAAGFSGVAFALIVLATASAGFGRNMHALRVVATFGVIVPAAVVLVWPNRPLATRIGAGLFALVVGTFAWWYAPCWSGGMNLFKAGVKRDALKMQMASAAFDDIKMAGQLQRGFNDLEQEYPKLAASLQPELARWANSAADTIAERLKQTPPNDLAAAREVRSRSLSLTNAFPDQRDRLDDELHAWVKLAVEARVAELKAIPLQDWAGFDHTATGRLALARAFPESRDELVSAEWHWVIKVTGVATTPFLPTPNENPTQAREVCRDIETHILKLKSVDASPGRFHVAHDALFSIAHAAARVEVNNLIRDERYGDAFTFALQHQLAWLPAAKLVGLEAEQSLSQLTEECRHLSIRFEKAGVVQPAPEPRTRETAPPPRSKS